MLEIANIRGLDTAWLQKGRVGENPIMLFLHGFPDAPSVWNAQFDAFAKTHLCLAPFGRGIAPSADSADKSRFGLDSVALDNLEILRSVDPRGGRKVCVVGHDIGAIHAWHLARLLGERLAALVIVNGVELGQMTRRITRPSQVLKSWYIPLFLIPRLPDLALRLAGGRWRRAAPTLNQYRQAAKTALTSILRRPENTKLAPVLVLWGRHDPYLEAPATEELERIADNPVIRILDGGHWIQEDEPKRVNALIAEFLGGRKCASSQA